MRIHCACLAIIVGLCVDRPVYAQAPKYKIQATDYQTVTATISYEIRTTKFAVDHWLVFMADPPELPSQSLLKSTCDPEAKIVTEKSLLARNVRFIDLTVEKPEPGSKLSLKQE